MTDDRRMWSTTPKGLSEFVGALLNSGIPSGPVHTLHYAFEKNRFYPARELPHLCTPHPPDLFFSYQSVQNFVDIQEIVWQTCDFAVEQLRRRRPELDEVNLESFVSDGIRLWVDFMFIDQAARDVREELEILPQILQAAGGHFVVGRQPLMRSWCCYEIALFNERFALANGASSRAVGGPSLRSYVAPSRSFYIGWEHTETSTPDDKRFIAESIRDRFPGGFDGFEQVMAQANSVAVGALADGSVWSTPAADDHLAEAAERWYLRSSTPAD